MNADAALDVYRDICEANSLNARQIDGMVDKIRPMLTELYVKSAEIRAFLKEQGIADFTHDEFMSAYIYELKEHELATEEVVARLEEWFEYERKHGEVLTETLRQADKSGLFDLLRRAKMEAEVESGGITWGFGVGFPCGFAGGGCQGMPMGIRIAQIAHRHGMPLAIVSGDHGTSALPLVSAFLRDKGVIKSAKHIKVWDVLNQDGSFKNGGEELIDQNSFFIANKGYKGEIDYSDQQAWTDHMLVQIVQSLLKRL
jgi:hypothetical protein